MTDKDLKQIPTRHYCERIERTWFQTHADGERLVFEQWLTGDSTDNYPGCPGIGPKRAKALLDVAADPVAAVMGAYAAKGLGEREALVQFLCARILTAETYRPERVARWAAVAA